MSGIEKRFGSVHALRGADFSLAPGEIHALLGENGAGKTTLMSVLFGAARPDSGLIELGGSPVRLRGPRDALERGIGMVHQHHTQVDTMTVAENVWLGHGGLRTDLAAAAALVRRIGAETGLEVDPAAIAGTLPVGLRQRVEIIKALARDARVLILDEPTSSLAPLEIETLFSALRRLRERGVSIILITHNLRDALELADHVTVLRAGASVLVARPADTSPRALAAAMIGGDARGAESPAALARTAAGDVVLSVAGGTVSLELRRGEIVGIAAVEGNGQRALLRAIAGLEPAGATISRGGRVAFVPEDRQREGLVLDFTLEENLALGRTHGFLLDRARLTADAERAVTDFAVTSGAPRVVARALSGGNQQKVVLARALASNPAVLVAENPTRGLDLHATRDVHARLRRAAGEGCGVLFHSTDLDEVLALSHRIGVMAGGRWRDVAAAERTRERVGAMMLGVA